VPVVRGAVHHGAAAPHDPAAGPAAGRGGAGRALARAAVLLASPGARGRVPRKAFTEQVPELPAGGRLTGRLRRHVAGRVADGLAVSVAGDGLVSWPTSHVGWVVHAPMLRWPSPAP
jgi:hypothetical protein